MLYFLFDNFPIVFVEAINHVFYLLFNWELTSDIYLEWTEYSVYNVASVGNFRVESKVADIKYKDLAICIHFLHF